jgi:hypothetical protein
MENADVTGALAWILAFGILRFLGFLIAAVLASIIPVICFWRIYEKAGFDPRLGLLGFIPGAQFVMLIFLAFTEW